jgi:hypothetical protein
LAIEHLQGLAKACTVVHHYAGSAARIKANSMHGHDIVITKIRKSRLRRKGGGRKPKPPGEGKPAQFQARIAADLRADLDTEAAATGLSVSAIASGLLRDGLRSKREREFDRDDPMRALWYLVAEAAKEICGLKPGLDWRTNPFAYEALKLAIVKIMDALKPAGGIRPPSATEQKSIALFGPFDTAKARAEHVAKIILHNLHGAEAMDVEQMFGSDLPKDVKARLKRTVYNMSDARKALLGRRAPGASQALPSGKKLGSKARRKSR